MKGSVPQTPQEALRHHAKLYNEFLATGTHPYVYPWAACGAVVVLIYLMLDHRQAPILKLLRYPIFAFLVAFQIYCMIYTRAFSPAGAFGIGLVSSFGVLWTAAIMIFNDCQADFKRIERRYGPEVAGADSQANGAASDRDTSSQNGMRRRKPDQARTTTDPSSQNGRLFWQSYPDQLSLERADWIADVFCSFRGVGWNWQTYGVPPAPKWVEAQLRGETDGSTTDEPITVSRTGIRRYSDRRLLLKHVAQDLILGYMALDLLTTFMHRDPYFWTGDMHLPAPTYLPAAFQQSFILLKCYRLLFSLAGVSVALRTIFKLGPAFFCGIVGPRWIGLRGEPWMNPADMYGDFTLVLDKGLAGWWGGWWHQTFRFAFEAPTTRLLEACKVQKRSTLGKAFSLFVAFFISGVFHASGSFTQLPPTRPLSGPFTFFILQAFGVLAQTYAEAQLRQLEIPQKTPQMLKRATNFVVVFAWLYFTAPLLVDDFARGGVWLFEPVPFSPSRALGLGAPEDRFFCWRGQIRWHNGKRWWDSGLAL
ncbi:Membrane bound O-acyl transferase family [Teratosphaeria destructans]|uniref:Membrane bound O-acyl transferase family n=1 Tax=Teratosphaeria destructans TaxID=418781 RepID=A0A9W7SM74_9PEZI|nr:Membrane bound O-acyl transferase family [Teratosphaeria destructans]